MTDENSSGTTTVILPVVFPGLYANSVDYWISNINPIMLAQIGVASVLAFSIIGAGWGIYNTGVSLVGAVLWKPEIRSKNLLSILFCEAIAIYGLIISMVLRSLVGDLPSSFTSSDGSYSLTPCDASTLPTFLQGGFAIFAAGVAVGLSCLASGVTVGVLGSGVCLAHADNSSLFVKLFICEIFAEAIALIALIAGIVVATSTSMKIDVPDCLCPYMCRDGYCRWVGGMFESLYEKYADELKNCPKVRE